MLPGETYGTDEIACPDCGTQLTLGVCRSAAGYYLGFCHCQGPISRESMYFDDFDAAVKALPQWRDFTRDLERRGPA